MSELQNKSIKKKKKSGWIVVRPYEKMAGEGGVDGNARRESDCLITWHGRKCFCLYCITLPADERTDTKWRHIHRWAGILARPVYLAYVIRRFRQPMKSQEEGNPFMVGLGKISDPQFL